MNRRTFTIIELIIVMTIISIMFLMTKNYFSSENKIYYEGETCINNMFYAIKDLNNAALLGRTRTLSGVISSGGNNIATPDRYNIVFRPPGYYASPHFTTSPETLSGMTKVLINSPMTGGILGTSNGQNIVTANLVSWFYMYRGTGDFTKTLSQTGDMFSIQYFPIWALNYLAGSGGFSPIKNCISKDYFVTYNISSAYSSGETAMRVGFQSSSTNDSKKMLIYHTQWLSGTIAETNTGAVNFQVCNKAVRCKETHRIFFDTRVNDMYLQRCTTYGANSKCTSWQGGNIN